MNVFSGRLCASGAECRFGSDNKFLGRACKGVLEQGCGGAYLVGRSRTGAALGWASTGRRGVRLSTLLSARARSVRARAGAVPQHHFAACDGVDVEPRFAVGPKIIFSSAGNDSTMRGRCCLSPSTSLRAFTPIEVFTYEMTVWAGVRATNAANSSSKGAAASGKLSAREQPASRSGIRTVLSGRLLAPLLVHLYGFTHDY